ncbi:DNA-directed RNA polymerase specialized sigma24 family protein [Acetoanaerobium pronyense]|uniref:DNA-directed RNA polymerase specialized sigma24 family protein n=1 Tax=Acetoanaerobium pronyense TaxID=1482736 RepID=A0ABS4KK05_9FIRM|nr:sigma-70 family RNA polymerase sigma factor [Acetoanaerobium pronyense]MBP2028122.1 DNA-directed RNA polymerase specialized sigma24 family protein [Acetoanaerobium pronyense]
MSKEKKSLEMVHEFLKEQEKKDKNQDRRYYRHNISLEYLEKKFVPLKVENYKCDSDVEKEAEALLAFIDAISNEHLIKALKKLTKSDLEIIELKYRFGLSINEIAIKLSLNNESTKKRHQRALAKLRKDLK